MNCPFLQAQFLIFEKIREEGYGVGVEDVRLTVEIVVPSSQVSQMPHFIHHVYTIFMAMLHSITSLWHRLFDVWYKGWYLCLPPCPLLNDFPHCLSWYPGWPHHREGRTECTWPPATNRFGNQATPAGLYYLRGHYSTHRRALLLCAGQSSLPYVCLQGTRHKIVVNESILSKACLLERIAPTHMQHSRLQCGD